MNFRLGTPRRALPLARLAAAALTLCNTALAAPSKVPLERVPLAKLSGAAGAKTMFSRIVGAEIGLDFVSALEVDHALGYLYRSGFACGGLALGDIDGDGLPDVFMAGGAGKNGLYRQLGGDEIKFEEITARSAGLDGGALWAAGVSMADIDGDGDLDIYICHYDAPNALFLNDGKGTFREAAAEWGLDLVDACHTPSFCDYDNDGDLDLYILTNRYEDPHGYRGNEALILERGLPAVKPEFEKYYKPWFEDADHWGISSLGRADYLMRNDGTKFVNASAAAGISERGDGLSVTWWDYNRDGLMDIYVGNDFVSPDRLYRNNGDGTFKDIIGDSIPHSSWFSMGADFGDVNNDGWFDFLTMDMSATNHFKQKTTMGVMGGDILRRAGNTNPPQVMRNAFLINTGTGRFLEAAYLSGVASSDWSWAAKFGDLDNDGYLDLFITNGTPRAMNDSDLILTNEQLKAKHEWEYVKHYPVRKEKNRAYRNSGGEGMRFEDVSDDWGLGEIGVSFAAAYADLDRDGDLDAVVLNVDSQVVVYRNDSQEGQRLLVQLRGTTSNRNGVGARLELKVGEQKLTRLVVPNRGFMGCDEPVAHFGLGTVAVADRLRVTWPSGTVQDLDRLAAGHRYVLTEPQKSLAKSTPETVPPPLFAAAPIALGDHVDKPFDDFVKQPLLPNKLSSLGPGVAWGDVDGDGDDDVYIGGGAGQPGELRLNEGKGSFEEQWVDAFRTDKAHEDMGAVFFDADGDGDLDLYVASGSYEFTPGAAELADRLYFNDGEGGFVTAPQGALPQRHESSGAVAAADYDRDGDLDLFVGGRLIPGDYPTTPLSQLLRNTGGKFTDVSGEVPGLARVGLVTSALWSDVNGDGWLDLLTTQEWGPVKLFVNSAGVLAEKTIEAGLAELTGWWNGIASGDFDGDGDFDFVVTNTGLNTKYHASPKRPVRLFHGDYHGDGVKSLVEAEYEDGVLYPVRGRNCSTRAMPQLANKFKTYREFALASLPDIYSETRLQSAQQYAATTLQSGILLNDGAGAFRFSALPDLAQISPGFGVVVVDADGDGNSDIYMVQNFFGPQAETGRFDSGLGVLLRGDGMGGFAAVWPAASGLAVAGDATALTIADLDGDDWPDFVVAQNAGKTRAFLNRGKSVTAHHMLKLRLVGSGGNPSAIGAMVRVTMKSGAVRSAEVSGGGGYLSQSAPALYFGLGTSDLVSKIDVRWPSGTATSTRSGPIDHGEVVIKQP